MRNVFSCGLLIMLVGYRADFELVRQPYTNLTGSLSKASKSACGRSSSMSGRANTREERAFYYTTSRARVRTIGYTTRVRRYPHSISPTSFSWGSWAAGCAHERARAASPRAQTAVIECSAPQPLHAMKVSRRCAWSRGDSSGESTSFRLLENRSTRRRHYN